jgi:hypothetical protein
VRALQKTSFCTNLYINPTETSSPHSQIRIINNTHSSHLLSMVSILRTEKLLVWRTKRKTAMTNITLTLLSYLFITPLQGPLEMAPSIVTCGSRTSGENFPHRYLHLSIRDLYVPARPSSRVCKRSKVAQEWNRTNCCNLEFRYQARAKGSAKLVQYC